MDGLMDFINLKTVHLDTHQFLGLKQITYATYLELIDECVWVPLNLHF